MIRMTERPVSAPPPPYWQPPPVPPKRRRSRWWLWTLGIIAAFLLGTGIGATGTSSTAKIAAVDTPVVTVTATVTGPAAAAGAVPAATAPASVVDTTAPSASDQPLRFGQSTTIDGLAITVTQANGGRASQYASSSAGQPVVAVTVTLRNTGSAVVDPALVRVSVTAGASGAEAQDVIDVPRYSGFQFVQSLAPGAVASQTGAFSVATGQPMTVQVDPPNFGSTTVGQWRGTAR